METNLRDFMMQMNDMRYVLLFGKSDRRLEEWAQAHAKVVEADGLRVIFLALYGENYTVDNFEFVNCYTLPLTVSLEEVQGCLNESINRALACDRSLTDYTFSASHRRYSRYSEREIESLVQVVGNALMRYVPRAEYCLEGLFDNFIAPFAFQFARRYGVKFYMIRLWQYWDKCFHVADAPGYASSVVNGYYASYYRRVRQSMYERVATEFAAERFSAAAFDDGGLRFWAQIVWDKFRSYERPSLRNALSRRIRRLAGRFRGRALKITSMSERPDKYIVFALHVMPEASILGTNPEVADQFSLLRRMSLNVPLGVHILCKPHPGDRYGVHLEMEFLRSLCSLHNVSLTPERERIDTFLSDERCVAVATINGSVALEAVMADKPCFLLGDGLFSIADCFLKPGGDKELFEQVQAVLQGRYSVDRAAVTAIILSMKRALVRGGGSQKAPGTWLDFYVSLLRPIHGYHKEIGRRRRRTGVERVALERSSPQAVFERTGTGK